MSAIADWIKRHQVIAFFVLVFFVSWPSMFLVFYVFPENMIAQAFLGLLATFSPAFVAMLIARIAHPGPAVGSKGTRWSAFVAAWLLSWLIFVLHGWQIMRLEFQIAIVLFFGIIALVPAWILSSAFARTPGIRKQFATLLKPRGNIIWYLIALFAFPVIQFLGAGITRLLGGEVEFRIVGLAPGGAVIFLSLTFLEGFLKSGGINEESGWRGFALPRLQSRYPVIVAVLIVWFFWALWHVPYDIGRGVPLNQILLNRIFHNLLWAIYFSWVYNRTKGSILAPALFHPAMNTFGNHLPSTHATTVLFVMLAVFAVLFDRMWKKLPSDHPAVAS